MKPEFFGSPKTAKVSIGARLTFLGLLTESDDEGKLLGAAKRIAGALFPNDDDVTPRKVSAWLDELERARFILRYAVDGVEYVFIPGFAEHQRVSHPTPSRIPGPPPELLAKISGEAPEDFVPEKEQGTGNREARARVVDAEFDALWVDYPRKVARKAAAKAYAARRREGVPAEDLALAVKHYAAAMDGQEERFIMHGSTFFGPNERWKDYLAPTQQESAVPDWMRGPTL
jgi:hypothetical protein